MKLQWFFFPLLIATTTPGEKIKSNCLNKEECDFYQILKELNECDGQFNSSIKTKACIDQVFLRYPFAIISKVINPQIEPPAAAKKDASTNTEVTTASQAYTSKTQFDDNKLQRQKKINNLSDYKHNSSTCSDDGSTDMSLIADSLNIKGKNYTYADFAQCGLFPACSLIKSRDGKWMLKCSFSIVVAIASISILLAAIVTFSNIVIIIITVRTKSLRKPHGYFKLSLASADLIAGVFVLPSIAHNILTKIDCDNTVFTSFEVPRLLKLNRDEALVDSARFFGIMSILSTITAVYSLLLLSADRFLAVMCPFNHKNLMTSRRAKAIVSLIWTISFVFGLIPFMVEDLVTYGMSPFTFQFILGLRELPGLPKDSPLLLRYCHAFVYTMIVLGLPFVITWILTLWTFIESLVMGRQMKEARNKGSVIKNKKKSVFNKEDRQLVRTVVVILSLFTITIIPLFAAAMLTLLVSTEQHLCYNSSQVWLFFLSTYILVSGRFINVIVYNVLNKEFRQASKKFFTLLLNVILRRKSKAMEGLPKRRLSSRKSWSIYGSSTKRRKSSSSKSFSRDTESSTPSFRSKLSLKKSISNSFKKYGNNNEFQGKVNTVCVCDNVCER